MTDSKRKSVVIVGAGAAGLYAAQLLKRFGANFGLEMSAIVEASDCVGGRIRPVSGFLSSRPVDIGGEYVHGSGTLLYKLAQEHKLPLKATFRFDGEGPSRCCFYHNGKMYRYGEETTPDIDHMLSVLEKLADPQSPLPDDVTFYEYMRANGVHEDLFRLAEALYARTYCTSASRIGVREGARDDRAAIYGLDNFRFAGSTSAFLDVLKSGLSCIKLNWPVKRIEYDEEEGVTLTNQKGESIDCDFVIVTVPVTVLADGDIEFSPPLPVEKREAASKIHMEGGGKVIIKFSRRFWPEHTDLWITDHNLYPQVWMNGPFAGATRGSEEFTVVGFVAGDDLSARQKRLGHEGCVAELKALLNKMFGTSQNPKPADAAYIGSTSANFLDLPFIRGAYSNPSPGAYGLRRDLAAPVAARVFFAGEATSFGQCATFHSAFETGIRAVSEVASFAHSTLPFAKL